MEAQGQKSNFGIFLLLENIDYDPSWFRRGVANYFYADSTIVRENFC